MGQQIIKQPNGQFAVFSSVTDTIVMWDATEQDVTDWFVERAVELTKRDTQRALDHVKADEPRKAYYQFAMSWDEALDKDRDHGGKVAEE